VKSSASDSGEGPLGSDELPQPPTATAAAITTATSPTRTAATLTQDPPTLC
jgi:hypothetical protein